MPEKDIGQLQEFIILLLHSSSTSPFPNSGLSLNLAAKLAYVAQLLVSRTLTAQ